MNSKVNNHDLQKIIDGIIDDNYLKQETGVENLNSIVHLNLTIDTAHQSVFDLGEILPNLKHLIFDNSTITSIRDLGTGLRYLTSLSLSSCGLHELDGVGVLTGLKELCLSDNYISDAAPLAMHENLEVNFPLFCIYID